MRHHWRRHLAGNRKRALGRADAPAFARPGGDGSAASRPALALLDVFQADGDHAPPHALACQAPVMWRVRPGAASAAMSRAGAAVLPWRISRARRPEPPYSRRRRCSRPGTPPPSFKKKASREARTLTLSIARPQSRGSDEPLTSMVVPALIPSLLRRGSALKMASLSLVWSLCVQTGLPQGAGGRTDGAEE